MFQMSSNLAAAIRWFPSQKQAIEERAARDESFRSICEDLADAESALQNLENSQSPKRDQRCSEYRELVDSLAKEIAAALSREREGLSSMRCCFACKTTYSISASIFTSRS
jgi:hypothetical protein